MAILLAFAMCITSGGVYVQSYASETDESSDAIQISSAAELAKIGKESGYPLDGSYVLTCDIDMKDYGDWTPIGYVNGKTGFAFKTATTGFTGKLDGNGHTISHMNAVGIDDSHNYVGLFGVIHKTAEIKNIGFKDCTVTATAGASAYAGVVAGGIYPDSSEKLIGGASVSNICIEDCRVTAKGRNLFNQTVAGSVVGYGDCVTMKNVWSNAKVEAIYDYTTEGHSQQIIAGGIVGSCWIGDQGGRLNLTNCVFVGTTDASKHYNGETHVCSDDCAYERTGAMLGANTRKISSNTAYSPVVENQNCYYDSDIANVNEYNKNAFHGTAMTMDELKSALSSTHMDGSDLWYNDATDGLKLKIGREFDATDFDGYTVLWDADDLKKINDNLSGNYVLAQDVNMAGLENWTPIGVVEMTSAGNANLTDNNSFSGVLNGNGHTIKNMTISYKKLSSNNYVNLGFFATTYGSAKIKNVAFEGCSVSGESNKQLAVGIVVGRNKSSAGKYGAGVGIDDVVVRNSTINCTLLAGANESGIGTIVGTAHYTSLNNCYSDADVTAVSKNANFKNKFGVAGMIGNAWRGYAQAEDCLFNGTIKATEIDHVHGIFGYNQNQDKFSTVQANFKDCYYNVDKLTVASDEHTETSGGSNGTALTTVDFGIRSVETLGLDTNYWIHTGYEPVLKISGETAWDGTPDVNGDGEVDICDLVRNKVFADDNTVEQVLYRATNMAESTDKDKITVNANDITEMRNYLLGMVEMQLNQTTAGQFKILGNTVTNAQEFYMDHSYTGFAFRAYAEGDVTVQFEYAPKNGFSYAKLAVVVDGNVDGRKVISISKSGTYTIATVEPGEHTFEVIKLTERNHDILKAKQISLKGMLKAAPEDATYKIQFIGDSITAASALKKYTKGDLNAEQEAQDIMQGYAYKTASELNADLSVRASSGIKTATAATALLPNNQSEQIVADDRYDVVVIGLGTNDNTENDTEKQAQLKKDVTTMLTNARTAYPNAKIVWIYGMMITVDNATIKEAVTEFARKDANVFYFDGFTSNQQGGAGHPNAEAHSAAGTALADYIKTEVLKSTN